MQDKLSAQKMPAQRQYDELRAELEDHDVIYCDIFIDRRNYFIDQNLEKYFARISEKSL